MVAKLASTALAPAWRRALASGSVRPTLKQSENLLPVSFLTIDTTSATPPFEQLRSQVMDAVRSGSLVAGTRLPTVRALADQLGLAANTVARAYRELEAAGVIETRGRNGSFIRPMGEANEKLAQEAAIEFADRMRRLGIPDDAAVALVRSALGR